ncbi:MAG: hypothetical protein H0U23_17625 [Blastocatellia bacterium]|nr:hypothetical protein [Blastocatellia bacterium]
MDSSIRPDHTLEAFVLADDYSFGIIQSDLHWIWFRVKCSRLKGDFRYTPRSVFDTFPWPQQPTQNQIANVANAAVDLRTIRRQLTEKLKCSLRNLYRMLEQPGDNPLRDAHARLDIAVRAAYGASEEVDPLSFLLELNLACAAKEKVGEHITGPGLVQVTGDNNEFTTGDCITAESVGKK